MAQSINDKLKLPPPFPHALGINESRYGFYCRSENGRFCFHNFHGTYAARHFLDMIMDDRTFEWIGANEIELSNGTRIRGEAPGNLKKVLDYEMSERERSWEPPIPDVYYWRSFARGVPIVIDGSDAHVAERKREVKRAPMPTELKVHRKKLKVKSGQYVAIADIAKELGVSPRDCRQALRQLKVVKPEHGWAWPPSDADAIRTKLRKKLGK